MTEEEQSERLKAVAEQISSVLTKAIPFEQFEIEMKPCICILRCPQDIDNYESLLSFGNSFHTYLPSGGVVNDMSETEDRRLFQLRNEMNGIISNAIAENRFEMYYQPIYSIKEKRFLSA